MEVFPEEMIYKLRSEHGYLGEEVRRSMLKIEGCLCADPKIGKNLTFISLNKGPYVWSVEDKGEMRQKYIKIFKSCRFFKEIY